MHALFYKSVKRDRIYSADSFSTWLRKFFTDGVFIGDLQVLAGDGMQVTVGAGYCNIGGKVKFWEGTTPLDIARANAIYDRVDNVVAERRDDDRDFFLKIITGTPAASPAPPMLVRENGVYQMVLGQVYVPAGSTQVVQANITDTRPDPDICGFVAATVDQIDFSQIQAQFDSYMAVYKDKVATDYQDYNALFTGWFERMRDQLSEDAAGHLQQQVDALHEADAALAGEVQVFACTLPADSWAETAAGSGVYEQTAACPGLLAEYTLEAPQVPVVGVQETDAALKEGLDALCEAGNSGETLDGALRWTCYGSPPTVDLPLRLRRAVVDESAGEDNSEEGEQIG